MGNLHFLHDVVWRGFAWFDADEQCGWLDRNLTTKWMQTDKEGAQKRVMMAISFNFIDWRAGAADGGGVTCVDFAICEKCKVRWVDIAVKIINQNIQNWRDKDIDLISPSFAARYWTAAYFFWLLLLQQFWRCRGVFLAFRVARWESIDVMQRMSVKQIISSAESHLQMRYFAGWGF
jgi:hypothetical protein